jgi:hypothetical protein
MIVTSGIAGVLSQKTLMVLVWEAAGSGSGDGAGQGWCGGGTLTSPTPGRRLTHFDQQHVDPGTDCIRMTG